MIIGDSSITTTDHGSFNFNATRTAKPIVYNNNPNITSKETEPCLSFEILMCSDHAGIRLQFGLLGYEIELHIYDSRHWNYTTNTWETEATLKEYK